jgi:hypothetical protein
MASQWPTGINRRIDRVGELTSFSADEAASASFKIYMKQLESSNVIIVQPQALTP